MMSDVAHTKSNSKRIILPVPPHHSFLSLPTVCLFSIYVLIIFHLIYSRKHLYIYITERVYLNSRPPPTTNTHYPCSLPRINAYRYPTACFVTSIQPTTEPTCSSSPPLQTRRVSGGLTLARHCLPVAAQPK